MKEKFLVRLKQTEEVLSVKIDGMVFTQTTIREEVKDAEGIFTLVEERLKEEEI